MLFKSRDGRRTEREKGKEDSNNCGSWQKGDGVALNLPSRLYMIKDVIIRKNSNVSYGA